MKPKHLIESLKLTYDLGYAREVADKMVSAAYPQFTEEDKTDLMMLALSGFQLRGQPKGVKEWSMAEIEEFVTLYQGEFQKSGDSIACYVMVKDLLNLIAQRVTELSDAIPEGFPFWFKAAYLNKAFQLAKPITFAA